MKIKTILIALVLFASKTFISAQAKFGAKVGIGFSSLTTKPVGGTEEKSSPIIAYYIGGLVERNLNEKFNYRLELGYASLGGSTNESDYGSISGYSYSSTHESKIGYGTLMMSGNFGYRIVGGFVISAGVNVGYIISAKNKWTESITVNGDTDSDSGENDIKEDTNPLTMYPSIGIEYCERMGLFLDVKYNFGISNLFKDTSIGTRTNNFLMIGLGYKFGGR